MNTQIDKPSFSLDEEVRDEYLISSSQKKIWSIQLDLLQELLRVCDKYDIKVYAFAGTLLGAIRHKGFIPWDDDLDVCLLREDFEKLVNIPQGEFKEPYFLQTALSDRKFYCAYARLRNSNTTGIIKRYCSKSYNNGIFIDIFVLDGVVENKFLFKKQRFDGAVICKLLILYYASLEEKKGFEKSFKIFQQKLIRKFFKYDYLVKKHAQILSRYNSSASKVALLTHSKFFVDRYWCYSSDFGKSTMADFENIRIPIPEYYDNMLKNMYGDYMTFPPLSKRGTWHDNSLIFNPDMCYIDYIEKYNL